MTEVQNPDRFYDYFVDAVEDVTLPSISSQDHLQNLNQQYNYKKNDSQLNMFESFFKLGNKINGVESSDSLLSAVSSSGKFQSQSSFSEQVISLRNIFSAVNFLTLPNGESNSSLNSELTPGSPRVYSEAENSAFIQEGNPLYPLYLMFTMIDTFLMNQQAEERV